VSVLFIDLDHFKQINDSYGHAAGDACLAAVVAPIQAELRQSDLVGRYGGEEFVVVLTGADLAAAEPVAQRICKRIADVHIEGFGMPIRFTCSIGVAASDALGVWGQHLIAHADSAQYAAKRSGRNQVQLAASLAA
jgi:diguanylate cyclase (GGDEF)-like protein